MNINDLIAHGFLDAILAVFLFIVGIMVRSLRDALKESVEDNKLLTTAINSLTVTVGRDYLTRAEHEREMKEMWERLDKVVEKLDAVAISLAQVKHV